MSNTIKKLISTGGTITMGVFDKDNQYAKADNKLYPVYGSDIITAAMILTRNEKTITHSTGKQDFDNLMNTLLETKYLWLEHRFCSDGEKKQDLYTAAIENNKHAIDAVLAAIDSLETEQNATHKADAPLPLSPISLNTRQQQLGYDVEEPYGILIDSIDWNSEEHYPSLLQSTFSALKKYDTVPLSGGTDSSPFYVSLLAKDLEARGALKEGKKVIFISSMYAFDGNPTLNARMFLKANLVAENKGDKDQKGIPGGVYVLSAADLEGNKAYIYDACQGFIKISSGLNDAFRSLGFVGNMRLKLKHLTIHSHMYGRLCLLAIL